MNLLVVGRITGSVLIICAYFVILHVSTLYGAMMHVVADLICMPFYIKHKQFDVVIMLCFLMTIAFSKVTILLRLETQFYLEIAEKLSKSLMSKQECV